jgi:hypothetical protein
VLKVQQSLTVLVVALIELPYDATAPLLAVSLRQLKEANNNLMDAPQNLEYRTSHLAGLQRAIATLHSGLLLPSSLGNNDELA